MSAWFDRFTKVWATSGGLDDPSDAEANAGFIFIGPAPPTVELFNSIVQWDDRKDGYLFRQIKGVTDFAALTLVETDNLTLLHALQAKFQPLLGYTPVQQGGGAGQTTTKLYLGWATTGSGGLKLQQGTTDMGYLAFLGRSQSWTANQAFTNITATDIYSSGNIGAAGTITGALVTSSGNINADVDVTAQRDVNAGRNVNAGTQVYAPTLSAGYIYSSGAITAAGTVSGGTVASSGNVTGNYLYSDGNIYAVGNIEAGGSINGNAVASVGNMYVGNALCINYPTVSDFLLARQSTTNARGIQFATGFALNWQPNNWQWLVPGPTSVATLDGGGSLTLLGNIFALNFPSDERIKRNIQPYTRGLKDVIQLEPTSYEHNGKGYTRDTGDTLYGVVAQQAKPFFPECVIEMEQLPNVDRLPNQLGFDHVPLLFAYINCFKEIVARLEKLESNNG